MFWNTEGIKLVYRGMHHALRYAYCTRPAIFFPLCICQIVIVLSKILNYNWRCPWRKRSYTATCEAFNRFRVWWDQAAWTYSWCCQTSLQFPSSRTRARIWSWSQKTCVEKFRYASPMACIVLGYAYCCVAPLVGFWAGRESLRFRLCCESYIWKRSQFIRLYS